MNCLPSIVIVGKTPLDIWSDRDVLDYSLLRVFKSLTYFTAKYDNVNLRAKIFVFLGAKRNMKGYKILDPKNKKIVLSKHVMISETLLLKSTISQHAERLKTKDVSQWWRLMLFHHLQLDRIS